VASDGAIQAMFEVCAAVWPRDDERVSELTLQIYARCLADVPDELLQAATVKIVSESTYYPKPAELRAAALALVTPEEPTAAEAWGYVCRYIRRVPAGGWYRGGEHVDPPALPAHIQRAVDAVGGLTYLRLSETSVADRARFLEVYQVLARRRAEEARMLPEVREAVRRLLAGGRLALGAGALVQQEAAS
jgi:hypothetical protein